MRRSQKLAEEQVRSVLDSYEIRGPWEFPNIDVFRYRRLVCEVTAAARRPRRVGVRRAWRKAWRDANASDRAVPISERMFFFVLGFVALALCLVFGGDERWMGFVFLAFPIAPALFGFWEDYTDARDELLNDDYEAAARASRDTGTETNDA